VGRVAAGVAASAAAEYRGIEAEGGGVKFGSVCSGIEAASVAWHPLGWQASWFAEIEPFPCAVLAHHYPDVPNLGDMTTIAKRVLTGEVEAPDVLAGGTPCQAFSVAGLRESLADERGNLTLKFVELADAIDFVRTRDGCLPAIVFWENVPGVLSTKDNAFGCFLAGLAGEDEPLQPPGGKWANSGAVYGPARAVAWRTLDAQYFGLAQRRRRVFVVASARDGFDPATVLFEWDGVRRDSAPSRESGKVAPTTPSRSTGGGGLGTDFDCDGGLIHADPIARCDTAGEAKRQDWETCNFVAHTLKAEGFDASEDGTGRGTPLVPVAFNARQDPDHWLDRTGPLDTDGSTQAVSYAIQAGALRTNPASGPDGVGVQADHAYTLEARAEVQAVAFVENSRAEVRLEGSDGSRCVAISTGGGKPGQGVPMIAHTMQVRRLTPRECERLQGFPDDYTRIPWKLGYWPADKHSADVRDAIAEQCPDGPRYKALGNSWAVPCVTWIGRRIAASLE
jgi:DNA (cytosine-5)-methyltransferase 1